MLLETAILWSILNLANAFSCHQLLGQLGDKESHLIQCITDNSVPVTVCTTCKEKYKDTLQIYDVLAVNCSSTYFDNDRINLVYAAMSALTTLWSRAFCDDCFNNNHIFEFNEKNTTFSDCLNETKSDPCETCKLQYLDLNKYFINLDQHNNGEVCYDIQDSMNRTRNIWSKQLKCCRRKQNMTLFTIVLSIISCLPLLFYGSTYFITKHQERNHGVLNDEDPVYNSELPSSSRRYISNDINNPIQSSMDTRPSSSNTDIKNLSTTTSSKPVRKNGFNINEDLESSDDDMPLTGAIKIKEK